MKKILLSLTLVLGVVFCASCGKVEYKDGTYEGSYKDTEHNSTMKVELKIKDNKITDVKMEARDKDGKIKGKDYGKEAGEKKYELAQMAVEGTKQYPDMLIKSQNLEDMDAVSGATGSFKQFKAAVEEALKKAEK